MSFIEPKLTALEVILGGASLALGAILTFSGVNLPLGIGLMAVGVASLVTAVATNWDNIKNIIEPKLAVLMTIISGASLVLGLLLCFTGAGIGLGLALIFAGVAGMVTAFKLEDNPILNFIKNIANKAIGAVNSIIDKLNDLFHIEFDGLEIFGKQVIPAFDVQLFTVPHIPTFAEGGMVETGQLFIAREAGAEMVGRIGNHTSVANNDQIVEGISEGVYNAVVSAMGNRETQDIVINLDGEVIYRNQQKIARGKGYNLGMGVYANV